MPLTCYTIPGISKRSLCFEETVFSSGVQAVGCLVVELILLKTLAFCNSSNTDRNSLPCVENISFFVRGKPGPFCNGEELVEINIVYNDGL